jgi:hypothetical protein
MDAFWEEAASFCGQLGVKSAVGPREMKPLLEGSIYHDYSECSNDPELSKPDIWILHRGLVSEWPEVVCRQIRSKRFMLLFSNDVFTITRSSSIPLSTWLASLSRDDSSAYRQLFHVLKDRKIEPVSKTTTAGRSIRRSIDKYEVDRVVSALIDVGPWDREASPNTSQSGEQLRDLQLMKANIKALAWRIEQLDEPAHRLESRPLRETLFESSHPFVLESRICTSTDIYSDWHRSLALCLNSKNYKLRKIWEWTFTLKALQVAGKLSPQSSGLGFGCGTEPLASCFANFAERVMVTDAPMEVIDGKGWSNTAQHTASLEDAKHEWLASRADLDRVLDFSYVDMNAIPESLHSSYDFNWSSCALEHLGSKLKGLEFVVNSSLCLKPGGIGIHTTEYDLYGKCPIDNWETVLFNSVDLLETLPRLIAEAERDHPGLKLRLLPFNLKRGTAFIDGYVDIPPYSYHRNLNDSFTGDRAFDSPAAISQQPSAPTYPYSMVNLSVDGYPSTSVAIIIERIA